MNKGLVTKGPANFEFDLIGGRERPFAGYISSEDKTIVTPTAMIAGSMNVVKTFRGTVAARCGLKMRGIADDTFAGILASYEWQTSLGATRPLRVANNKLQVESDIVTPGSPLWYDLYESGTGLNPARTLTRFVFDPWWESLEQKDRLVMVRGDSNLLDWSGGISTMGTVGSQSGVIVGISASAAGSGYVQGDIVTITGGGGAGGTARINSVSGGTVTAIVVMTGGTGYMTGSGFATSGGTGTGLTVAITAQTAYTITKQNTSTTWVQDGFASYYANEKVITINGTQYTYISGESTDTLSGVVGDPSAEPAGSVVLQSVRVRATTPDAGFTNDFFRTINNQLLVGSYTSKILYLSADSSVGSEATTVGPGFTDFINGGSFVYGDPDKVIIDNPPTGIGVKNGQGFVFAGTSDIYIITPNSVPPISFVDSITGNTRFIITKVEKKPGAGFSAAQCHEMIDNWGDDIVYLDQRNQLRILGVYRNIVEQKNPMISLAVHDELKDMNFTGGALRAIDTIVYITAPTQGVHYMYEAREDISPEGNIGGDNFWHTPQVSGISRFAVISGVVYGHSNANPMIYQVWETNQWHDDGPDEEPLPYTSVMRMAYRSHERRQGLLSFDKVYYEGYCTQGTNLSGYAICDYQASSGLLAQVINSATDPATFFAGNPPLNLGDSSLGNNPLGIGVVPDYTEQELLPKFRAICGINLTNISPFEYSLQVYSEDLDSRWEILYLGTNAYEAQYQPTFIRK